MTIVKGLKNINALVEKPKYESTGTKVRWVKLADGHCHADANQHLNSYRDPYA